MMGNNATLLNSCIACSLLLPTDAVYRMAISRVGGLAGGMFADIGPFGAASTPSVWMRVYTLIYIIIILIMMELLGEVSQKVMFFVIYSIIRILLN